MFVKLTLIFFLISTQSIYSYVEESPELNTRPNSQEANDIDNSESLFFLIIKEIVELGNNNWIFAFLGAFLISSFGRNLYGLLVFSINYFRKPSFMGGWYNHVFSFNAEAPVFMVEKIDISMGFIDKYIVKGQLTNKAETPYRGKLMIEDSFMIIEMNAEKHIEKTHGRFHIPPAMTEDTMLCGVSVAKDFSGYSTTGVNVLSRKQLSEEEVLEIIKSRAKLDRKRKSIQVRNFNE